MASELYLAVQTSSVDISVDLCEYLRLHGYSPVSKDFEVSIPVELEKMEDLQVVLGAWQVKRRNGDRRLLPVYSGDQTTVTGYMGLEL